MHEIISRRYGRFSQYRFCPSDGRRLKRTHRPTNNDGFYLDRYNRKIPRFCYYECRQCGGDWVYDILSDRINGVPAKGYG